MNLGYFDSQFLQFSFIPLFSFLLLPRLSHLPTKNLVSSLERSRAAMVEDLASLSTQNEALKVEVQTIPELREKLQVSYGGGAMCSMSTMCCAIVQSCIPTTKHSSAVSVWKNAMTQSFQGVF